MGIDINKLVGKLFEIANSADKNAKGIKANNDFLDSNEEISLFMSEAKKAIQNKEITQDDVYAIFGLEKNTNNKITRAASSDNDDLKLIRTYLESLSSSQKETVTYKTRLSSEEDYNLMAYNLDKLLTDNEITGIETRPGFRYQFDFSQLVDFYNEKQNLFNEVESKIDNWYNAPTSSQEKNELKEILESTIQSVLGNDMTYEDYLNYLEMHKDEVETIKGLPVGQDAASKLERAKKVALMSEEGQKIYHVIEQVNSALYRNFKTWEHEMILKANDKTFEMGMEVMDSMFAVEMNEFAKSEYDFEMPKNWLVKQNFKKSTYEVAGIADSIDSLNTEKDTQVKKYMENGKLIIKKLNGNTYNAAGIMYK